VTFVPSQTNAQVNGTVTVSLMVENAADLAATGCRLVFVARLSVVDSIPLLSWSSQCGE
jgi:hypothetical protein